MIDILLRFLFITMASFCIGLIISSIILPFTTTGTNNENLNNKINEYEKILNREFGQTFENYNEYLVYKIELGG